MRASNIGQKKSTTIRRRREGAAAPNRRRPTGFNHVLRTVGGAVGAALSAAVLAAHPSDSAYSTDEGITMAFGVGVICCAAVMLALVLHAVTGRRRRAHR